MLGRSGSVVVEGLSDEKAGGDGAGQPLPYDYTEKPDKEGLEMETSSSSPVAAGEIVE